MIRRCTLSLFLLIQATAEAFAPPALFVGSGSSAIIQLQHQQLEAATTTPDFLLDHLFTTTTIAEEAPDPIAVIADSILIYPLGIVAVSLVLYGLTFVAEKIMVPEEERTKSSTTNKESTISTTTSDEKDDVVEKPPVVLGDDASDLWSD